MSFSWFRLAVFLTGTISTYVVALLAYVFFVHYIPRKARRIRDILKIDPDREKRKELDILNIASSKDALVPTKKIIEAGESLRNSRGILLGFDKEKGKPVVIDEELLTTHMHVLGSTGAGKSKLLLLPLARQVIRKGRGCIFISFKKDQELAHALREIAEESGKRFFYFSLDPDEPSHTYNPIYTSATVDVDPASLVERVITALRLHMPGEASFYTNAQRAALINLVSFLRKHRAVFTFRDLYYYLTNAKILKEIIALEGHREMSRNEEENVLGAGYALVRMAQTSIAERFNVYTPHIIPRDIVANENVLYMNLVTDKNPDLATCVGRMLMLDLQYSCGLRNETSPIFYVFVDEFQDLASEEFSNFITKVRSSRIALILANQSMGQLKQVSEGFTNVVLTNTTIKVIFRLRDARDAEYFSRLSGYTTYTERSLRVEEDEEALGVELDGATTAKGSLVVKSKPLVHPNVFLSLAQGESIVFGARVTPTAVRHGYVLDRREKNYVGVPIAEIPDHPEHQLPPDHTTAHEVYLKRLLRHGKTKGKERETTTTPTCEPIGCAVAGEGD